MAQELTGEEVFFSYAGPVLRYCGIAVSEAELKELEEMLRTSRAPSKQRLEEIFPNAVKSMRQYAGTDGLDIWLPENVRKYWLKGHNGIVGNNRACMVYLGEVLEVLSSENGGRYRVKLETNGEIDTRSHLNLKKGDKVALHAFQIAEKL